jgi:hypothetical protein
MATHRLPILGFATVPDTSGNVYLQPLDVSASNDVWDHLVFAFADTSTRIGLHGSFEVPQNYAGTAKLVVVWTSTATSGNVVWDFDYRAVGGDDAESLDQAGTQESVTGTDAAPGAAWRRLERSIDLTSANLAAGDTVQFTLFRDGADAADTMAATAFLFDLRLQYADA